MVRLLHGETPTRTRPACRTRPCDVTPDLCVWQGDSIRSKGEEVNLHAPLDKLNLHLREGSVTPTQVSPAPFLCRRPPSPTSPSTRGRCCPDAQPDPVGEQRAAPPPALGSLR